MASRYLTTLIKMRSVFTLHFIGQVIILAATFIFINRVFAAEPSIDTPDAALPCAELSGVFQFTAGNFLMEPKEGMPAVQRTLVADAFESGAFSWLEVSVVDSHVQFLNRRPGLGIPITIFSVRTEWISESGELVSKEDLVGDQSCSGISLFPGGSTRRWKLVLPPTVKNPRLRVRLVASPY